MANYFFFSIIHISNDIVAKIDVRAKSRYGNELLEIFIEYNLCGIRFSNEAVKANARIF